MNERNNSLILQIVMALSIVLTIIVNALLEAIPLGGATSGEISDSYPSLFTPPGYVFAIWSVIYTLLIITMVYQALPSQRNASYLKWTAFFYAVGGIINTSWLTLFHLGYGAPEIYLFTPILIFSFLIIMLFTYIKMGIGVNEVPIREKLAVHIPISVYAGWVSLASIANTASALNVAVPGIPLAAQEIWTALVIIIALVITMLMLLLRRDFAYGLVVVWATIGISTRHLLTPIIYWAALGTALVVVILIILLPILKKANPVDFYLFRNREE